MSDHPETYVVNVRELLVDFYQRPIPETADPVYRRQLTRFQERARAALEVEALKEHPRRLDEVLWTTFRGEELARRLQAHGYEALGWLLGECSAGLS